MRKLLQSTVIALLMLSCAGLSRSVAGAVAPKPSRTTFASSAKQVTEGDSVVLKATVSPLDVADGSPTGSVEFFDGAISLGSVTLVATNSGNDASLSLSTLAVGPHPISAVYSGSATFGGSTSVPEFVLVLVR